MLETGIKGKLTQTVTDEMTAAKVGSGTLPVFATPSMAALIEKTAMQSVAGELDEGQCTVGTRLDIVHIKPSVVGRSVTCETELCELDRRRLVFDVTVSDERGVVGSGKHERFIVDSERFMEKANQDK